MESEETDRERETEEERANNKNDERMDRNSDNKWGYCLYLRQ
jgi:hypothetical protein